MLKPIAIRRTPENAAGHAVAACWCATEANSGADALQARPRT
jgi:hypothetical protein